MNALLERWHAMTEREQRMVAIAIAAVAAALVWFVAIEPALDGTQRIEKALPRVRAQAAEVAGLAQLAAQRPATTRRASGDLRAAIQASLDGLPTKPTVASNGTVVTVKFEGASYPQVAQWAGRALRESGAHIETASVTAGAEPGRATIELGFAR